MNSGRGLRAVAAVLAPASAVLHLMLFRWDLIPGQPTTGAAPFLVMTVLYVGVAAVAWLDLRRLYLWSAAYTAATIVGYFATRVAFDFPMEVWGLSDKALEVALLASLVLLWRTSGKQAAAHQTG